MKLIVFDLFTLYMLEKGNKDCVEDQRFRRWEEFKMASLVYEAWHAYY